MSLTKSTNQSPKSTAHEIPEARAMPEIRQDRLEKSKVRVEAEKRASFVCGMGGAVAGYAHGYMDGFEHAIQWLLGESPDLFELDYRPDAGMGFSKRYYFWRPLEKRALLERFERHFTEKSRSAEPQEETPRSPES
jgi:hypothetical protein